MTRALISEIALAVCLASGGFLVRSGRPMPATGLAERQLALDGAFRDGLFVGQLTAKDGRPLRPPVGRWSSDSDRASFLAGYHRGYNDALRGTSGHPERTE